MKVRKVGNRGFVFVFEEPFITNSYVILGENRTYVCDTAFGPDSMRDLVEWLRQNETFTEDYVVFNSHGDYDHIWGNCHFTGSIWGHYLCRERIQQEGHKALQKYKSQSHGKVTLVPPNAVFHKEIGWDDDGVKFFHTPGHTVDSASCYDVRDRVLFVGDNIEAPLPYLNSLDFITYLKVLDRYQEMRWSELVTGHDEVQDTPELLSINREYISKLNQWDLDVFGLKDTVLRIHLQNLSNLSEELMQRRIETKVRKHYTEALDRLDEVDSIEVTQGFLDKLERVAGLST